MRASARRDGRPARALRRAHVARRAEAAAERRAARGDGSPPVWIIALPLVGAIAHPLRAAPGARRAPRWTTLGLMVGDARCSRCRSCACRWAAAYHFNEDVLWMPRFGIHYHVALDGISLWLVLLTSFITPIAAYASFGSIQTRIKDWCFALLLLEGAMLGAFLSLDLFLFYVFWELMLIPMYVMIGVWGGVEPHHSAVKFFLYTMFGSVLMLGRHPLRRVRVRARQRRACRASTTSSFSACSCRGTCRSGSGPPSRSPSSSRCRCCRCTRGCRTRTPRRRRRARSSWPRSCSRWGRTGTCASRWGSSPRRRAEFGAEPRRRRRPRRHHLRRALRVEAGAT